MTPLDPKETRERKQNYQCGAGARGEKAVSSELLSEGGNPPTTWNQNSKRQGIKHFNLPVFLQAAVCWCLQLGKFNLKSGEQCPEATEQ